MSRRGLIENALAPRCRDEVYRLALASYGRYVRVYKIIAFKQQWFAGSLGKSISEAITEI